MKKVLLFLSVVFLVASCALLENKNKTLMYDEFNPNDYLKVDSMCNHYVFTKILYHSMYDKFSNDFDQTWSSDEEYAINKKIKVLNNLYEADSLLNYDKSTFGYFLNKKSSSDSGIKEGFACLANALDEMNRALSFAFSKYSNIEEDFSRTYDTYRRLTFNTICESRLIASDENSKTFQLRFYNSNIDEKVLIKFSFNDRKECVSYRFL